MENVRIHKDIKLVTTKARRDHTTENLIDTFIKFNL